MNKYYLTIIVSAFLCIGPPTVLGAGPTVFGQLHVSFDRYENDSTSTAAANEQGYLSSNFSRVGVKGDGDLDGGMKYVYQVLVPLRTDDGSGGLGGTLYDTYAGLGSDLGSLRFGRMDSPVKDLSAVFNQFGTRVGDSRNITGLGGLLNFDNRFSDVVRYDSPKFGPATFALYYSSSEDSAYSSTVSDVASANVRWSDGPLSLGLGYESHNTAAQNDETIVRLVGSYGFGFVTVAALYEKMSDLAGTSNADRDSLGVAAAFKFGNSVVKLQYVETDKVDTATTDNGAKMLAVGFDYNLNKAVQLYAVYAQVDNDAAGTFKTAGAGAHGDTLNVNTGGDQTGLSAGLIVNF